MNYFDKYEAFCFDLSSDSVLKGDLNLIINRILKWLYQNEKHQNLEEIKEDLIIKFLQNVIEDKKSGEYRLSHHIDLKTGTYNGKQILEPKK